MDDGVRLAPGAYLTVFRSRLHPEAVEAYGAVAPAIEERARAMPGFVEFKSFVADDGERLSLVVFDGAESHCRWRDDPEHRRVQSLGRSELYAEYAILVGELVAERRFLAEGYRRSN